MSPRKAAIAAVIGVCIINGIGRGLMELRALPWEERSPRAQFLDEARSRIPESEVVFVALAQGCPRGIENTLYPRIVKQVQDDQLRRLGAERPDAWVVVIPHPFVADKAFVGQARDLR